MFPLAAGSRCLTAATSALISRLILSDSLPAALIPSTIPSAADSSVDRIGSSTVLFSPVLLFSTTNFMMIYPPRLCAVFLFELCTPGPGEG